MARNTVKAEFEFVIHLSDGNRGASKADRIRIRRQAMKAIGIARRQSGNYGQHNLRQYPVYVDNQEQTTDTHKDEESIDACSALSCTFGSENSVPYFMEWNHGPPHAVQETAWITAIPTRPSNKGFELIKIQYGVDILDLSGLVTIHVGRAAARILSSNRTLLARLLQCKQQWSYLSYLPSIYGYNACLDDATHCVAAKIRQIVCPTDQFSDAIVLSLYGKALKSLQAAVNDPVSCLESNVLCATEILALFELLSFSGGDTWKHHMSGARRLIELRGPQSYKTEFDKALFMALAGLILTEAILNNERCFLEREEWQEVLQSMIVPDSIFADRSPIVISLWSRIVHGAGLFKDVTSLIFGQEKYSQARIEYLICCGLRARESLIRWRRDFNALLESTPQDQYDKRCQILGVSLSCLALLNRIIGAIDPSRRAELEEESHALASEVARMEKEATSKSPMAGFFLSQKMSIAQSILESATTWKDCRQDEHRKNRVQGNLIEKWRFEHWCMVMGRTTYCTD